MIATATKNLLEKIIKKFKVFNSYKDISKLKKLIIQLMQ